MSSDGSKGKNWLAIARKGGRSIRNVLKPAGLGFPLIPTTDKKGAVLDSETMDLLSKSTEKIMSLLKLRRLIPRNCPPFLPDVLSKIISLVTDIRAATPELCPEADQYMRRFVMVFLEKTKTIVRILKSEGSKVLREETSTTWRSITRMTMTLNNNKQDLEAMFPNKKYVTEWRLAKNKADDFWRDHFDKQAFVSWEVFSEAFTKVHPLSSKEELGALWLVMDMTDNGCISWFEFDVFTRLFQPWTNIIDNWKVLTVAHPGYKSHITYTEMNRILEKLSDTPGSYVYRTSCTKPGTWVVGYVSRQGLVVQTQPINKAMFQTLIDFAEDRTCVYPCGNKENPDIRRKVDVDVTEYVKVTEEEEEMYMVMGTTFGLCKICANNNKNLRINPCGHMMCNECLNDWTKTGGKVCPFCRTDIIDVDEISVESKPEPDPTSRTSAEVLPHEAHDPSLEPLPECDDSHGAFSAVLHYTGDDAGLDLDHDGDHEHADGTGDAEGSYMESTPAVSPALSSSAALGVGTQSMRRRMGKMAMDTPPPVPSRTRSEPGASTIGPSGSNNRPPLPLRGARR